MSIAKTIVSGLLFALFMISPALAGIVNSRAPEFTLQDLSGKPVSLSDFKGKVVFIDFWASWCPPCRELMPKLQEFYQSNKDTVIIVGISGDNTLDAAKSFVTKNNITFPIVFDETKEVFRKYQIAGIPAAVVINTKGEIVQQGHFSIEELQEIVKSVK